MRVDGACLPAGAALLHDLGAVEAGQLAEAVVAVDDGPLHDLSVPYEEAGLWGTGEGADQAPDRDLEPAPETSAGSSAFHQVKGHTLKTAPLRFWSKSGKSLSAI